MLAMLAASALAAAAPPPAPAQDGLIVFTSARAGGRQLFAMAPDGSGLRQLTSAPGNNFTPAVSPDGTKVAFASTRSGDAEIWVVNIDGTGAQQLTSSPGADTDPSWSPDGARIAFTSDRGSGDGAGQILTMQSDGSNVVTLTRGPYANVEPAWSPDCTCIAFRSLRDQNGPDGANSEIYRMNTDGSQQRNLTRTPGEDENTPAWSPDGTRIAYGRDGSGIYTMTPEGTDQAEVTVGPRDTAPTYSPAGDRLAFTGTGEEPGPDLDLRVVTIANPADQTVIAAAPGLDTAPSWGSTGAPASSCPVNNPNAGGAPDAPTEPERTYEVPSVLRRIELTPQRFRPARRGTSIAARTAPGARLDFRLSGAGTVKFKLRRVGRGGPRTAPGFSVRGVEGSNAVRFTGRSAGRALRPGRWRLRGRAEAGKVRTVAFRILPRR